MFNIDIQYTWLLLFLPLVVAAFDWFLLTKRPDVAALTSTFVLSLGLLDRTGSDSFSWLPISDIFSVDLGFVLDPLSSRMMLVVTGIGLLVHVFSLAYMADDKAKTRYFACLSLFMFSMTGIVLANNIAMTFIFWELVGLSSYLLIGHWYTRDTAANAAKKAFICNRVGDFGFLIGILTLWALTNTLDYGTVPLLRSGGQIRPIPAARLASGRHGRPHPRLRPDPCGHHGSRRRLHDGARPILHRH